MHHFYCILRTFYAFALSYVFMYSANEYMTLLSIVCWCNAFIKFCLLIPCIKQQKDSNMIACHIHTCNSCYSTLIVNVGACNTYFISAYDEVLQYNLLIDISENLCFLCWKDWYTIQHYEATVKVLQIKVCIEIKKKLLYC